MADFFAGAADIPLDRSSLTLRAGEETARAKLVDLLKHAGKGGARWCSLWPPIFDTRVVTHSRLGRIANDLRKSGIITTPHWPSERHKMPKEEQLLRIS